MRMDAADAMAASAEKVRMCPVARIRRVM